MLETLSASRSPLLRINSILKNTALLGGATYLSRVLCALRSLINARWLGPGLYGFWGSLSFLVSFGFHLHAGVQDIMVKQIPTYRSQGRDDLAARVAQQSFSFFSLGLLLAAFALGIVVAFLPESTPTVVRWGWWIAAVTLPLEALYFFEQNVMRCEERFGVLNRALLLASVVSLMLTCWLVIRYGITGLFIVAVLTPLMGLICLRRFASYPWKFTWDVPLVKSMLKAGWPILAMTLVFESLWWVDRFLVLGFYGTEGFGYYMLGVMVMQLSFLFPQVMASVIEPRLHYDYAKSGGTAGIRDHLWLPLRLLSFALPLALAFADLLLPRLIHWVFPAYVPGIAAMRVLLWGSVFMGLIVSTKSFIVAIGKQRAVLPFYVAAVVVNLAVSLTLALQGRGLAGIAAGTLAACLVCATGLLSFVFNHLGESTARIVGRIVSLYAPSAVVIAITIGLPSYLEQVFSGLSPVAVMTVGGGGLGVCAAIFAWILIREFRSRQLSEGAEVVA
ncbi:MAG: oligosaccharide flippase family protein [Candidatus Omnitrophota bacterium]|nr:oligosaccharide flippase family protein [Candidatus Omnitrophota bacterium]